MPAYEGLGIGVERAAVVLDVGFAHTKCGFSGESSPRFIIPSKAENIITKKVVDLWTASSSELSNVLIDFIYHIYFRLLSISPRERRVVICESLVCPAYFRQAFAETLFKHFEAPSILYLPSQQLPLYTLGIQTAIVVDVGSQETTLIPFVEGIPLVGCWDSVPCAGNAIQRNVANLMMEKCMVTDADGVKPLPASRDMLNSKVLEDITVRTCFVRGLSPADATSSVCVRMRACVCEYVHTCMCVYGRKLSPPLHMLLLVALCPICYSHSSPTAAPADQQQTLPVNYPVDDDTTIIIDGHVRSCAADVMFVDDTDGMCLPRSILSAIAKAPIDCRKLLAENLVIVGGASEMPGFRHRLLAELKAWLGKPEFSQLSIKQFKMHQNLVPANTMCWVGASIYSATGVLKERSLSKDTYAEKGGKLPDWTSCDPDLNAADALSWQKKRSIYSLPVSKASAPSSVAHTVS
ncbi:actin-related protein 10-like [Sycon ciliatum]|uniref:actin-related protein 10-like n=1 Tax=Sycon ciliatum TaxID=27933 RepID=UPI0031F5F452